MDDSYIPNTHKTTFESPPALTTCASWEDDGCSRRGKLLIDWCIKQHIIPIFALPYDALPALPIILPVRGYKMAVLNSIVSAQVVWQSYESTSPHSPVTCPLISLSSVTFSSNQLFFFEDLLLHLLLLNSWSRRESGRMTADKKVCLLHLHLQLLVCTLYCFYLVFMENIFVQWVLRFLLPRAVHMAER